MVGSVFRDSVGVNVRLGAGSPGRHASQDPLSATIRAAEQPLQVIQQPGSTIPLIQAALSVPGSPLFGIALEGAFGESQQRVRAAGATTASTAVAAGRAESQIGILICS